MNFSQYAMVLTGVLMVQNMWRRIRFFDRFHLQLMFLAIITFVTVNGQVIDHSVMVHIGAKTSKMQWKVRFVIIMQMMEFKCSGVDRMLTESFGLNCSVLLYASFQNWCFKDDIINVWCVFIKKIMIMFGVGLAFFFLLNFGVVKFIIFMFNVHQ